ncbi:MAG: hypothetical protein PHG91_09635 [Syntrophales bacterium]|nr:hypothetical protein [Syntrophales bacterium]MDD5233645.1 hypothetical protein [Syntrophales bacterium]MDD5531704.1 hypothetical protein [Syntrophales bacterium]HPL63581.1 hypothetical protein [Syntrophales bacterium]
MEYVKVCYPDLKKVLVDGEVSGWTNEIMRLEEGTHTFCVDCPRSKPKSRTVKVSGTDEIEPKEVRFAKK